MIRKLYVIVLAVYTIFYINVCVAVEPYPDSSGECAAQCEATVKKGSSLTKNDIDYLCNPLLNFTLSGMKFKANFGFTNEATTKVENDSVFPLEVKDKTVYRLSVGYMEKPIVRDLFFVRKREGNLVVS